jgi:glyoxylase-like metal-dependent hydrolase (beta-lactamase superfamily II)
LLVTDPWYEVQRFPHGITMIREPHQSEDVKSYLVEGERDVAIIDTGTGAGDFPGLVASLSSKRPRVLQSHGHWDHAGHSYAFDEVLIHPTEVEWLRGGFPAQRYITAFSPEHADVEFIPAGFDPSNGMRGTDATGTIEHGDLIDLGNRVLEVIHTPGHSAGGVTFLDRTGRALFVADVVYLSSMYLFFVDSDTEAFRVSLDRLIAVLDDVDLVFPAHGDAPMTPQDVRDIQAAFAQVSAGEVAATERSLLGYEVDSYDFGRFSFLLPRGWKPRG